MKKRRGRRRDETPEQTLSAVVADLQSEDPDRHAMGILRLLFDGPMEIPRIQHLRTEYQKLKRQ
jgi:hypothetical protein